MDIYDDDKLYYIVWAKSVCKFDVHHKTYWWGILCIFYDRLSYLDEKKNDVRTLESWNKRNIDMTFVVESYCMVIFSTALTLTVHVVYTCKPWRIYNPDERSTKVWRFERHRSLTLYCMESMIEDFLDKDSLCLNVKWTDYRVSCCIWHETGIDNLYRLDIYCHCVFHNAIHHFSIIIFTVNGSD